MEIETEQKWKLSTSNIIALGSFLFVLIGGFTSIKYTQAEFNQRITTLEKANEESKTGFSKFDFKLDKINESLNQLKVDMAGQRVEAAERDYNKPIK